MMKLHQLIATALGIGYMRKGSGTVAAAALCIIWILIPASLFTNLLQVLMTILVTIAGIWSGNAVDAIWGKDSNRVVIDEVAGMMVTLLFIPVQLKFVVAGFILFRFFDIVKPLLIRKLELLPRGWGVMADDLLAGIYANILLQLIVRFHLL